MNVLGAWSAIGLGSNLGDRAALIQAAVELLAQVPGLVGLERAPLYETTPVDCSHGSPPFLNTVVQAHYTGDLFVLLEHCQRIEHQLGRVRTGARNESRPIDMDLLMVEGVVLETDQLILPHPRLHRRLFVLLPLADLRPDLTMPNGQTIHQAARGIEGQNIHPASEALTT